MFWHVHRYVNVTQMDTLFQFLRYFGRDFYQWALQTHMTVVRVDCQKMFGILHRTAEKLSILFNSHRIVYEQLFSTFGTKNLFPPFIINQCIFIWSFGVSTSSNIRHLDPLCIAYISIKVT